MPLPSDDASPASARSARLANRRAGEDRPLLASEALRDELAPTTPLKNGARWCALGAGLLLFGLGLAFRLGVGPSAEASHTSSFALSAAAAVALLALLPFSYGMRALGYLLAGGALLGAGLAELGPLRGLALDGGLPKDLARVASLAFLPAALLFRAHYRAYRGARWVLGVALLAALPFALAQLSLATSESSAPLLRAGALVEVIVVACALFGFMGSGSTGAGTLWAGSLLIAFAGELSLRQFTPLADAEMGFLTYPATAIALLAASVLVAVGLFQGLATLLAADARRRSASAE